ncbi:MAG: iron-containing alcohol dehydrogenase [Desulfobacterales bacterium]|jgi:alcohol dehydrogenase class IV
MQFEFSTATQVIFGTGKAREIGKYAPTMGRRAMVVTGRSLARADIIVEQLDKQGIESISFSVPGEPTTDTALAGVQKARQAACDCVIGIGGGSVLDTGKVIAALLTNEGKLLDYLEVIGKGKPLENIPAPYVAVPTTAGTGAEVTRNSVLESQEHRVKVSMRSPLMLPRRAVVDPELTYSMPPPITASTGMDAFTQLLEAYVSNKANPLTDGICREGLRLAAGALVRVFEDGSDTEAREAMSLASLFGGLALANAKLGAVHGIAGPLGGMFKAAHGAVCGRLLPFVMETNISALQMREPQSSALARYREIAQIVTGNTEAKPSDAINWIQNVCSRLKLPPLADYKITVADIPLLVEKAQAASSMKGNPIQLSEAEMVKILRQAL